jgi:hypothetical protein
VCSGGLGCGRYAEEVGGERGAVRVVRHEGYDLGDDGIEGEREAEDTVKVGTQELQS